MTAALLIYLGYALLRLTLGVDFLFHAYQRWFDPAGFIDGIVRDFAHTPRQQSQQEHPQQRTVHNRSNRQSGLQHAAPLAGH